MTNDPLLRPSVLGNNSTVPNQASQTNFITQTDLTEQVTRIVADVIKREGRLLINSLLNPGADINNDIDQTIDTTQTNNITEMDRIPDVVKCLREFSGQPGEFSSWKKSVERILGAYEHLKGTPKYFGILNVIRNKITGHADIALESYNTPLNWNKISKCLTLHYADKRDLGTLEYQMTTLVQGNRSIPEFYQAVYHHLSLILNKLSCMDISTDSLNNLTQVYRDKALDTFVRGLRGDLPKLLSIKEPIDLPQALHLCMKLENVDFRVQYANNQGNARRSTQIPPPLPPRRSAHHTQQTKPFFTPRREFYPELLHDPHRTQVFNPNRNYYSQNQYPQRPPQNSHPFLPKPAPKPLPKPEPMDVDQSIRSNRVNYQNRPQFNQFPRKRTPQSNSMQANVPNKYQRVFNIEHANDGATNEMTVDTEQYEQNASEHQDYDQSLADYINQQDDPSLDPPETLADIYFLD